MKDKKVNSKQDSNEILRKTNIKQRNEIWNKRRINSQNRLTAVVVGYFPTKIIWLKQSSLKQI